MLLENFKNRSQPYLLLLFVEQQSLTSRRGVAVFRSGLFQLLLVSFFFWIHNFSLITGQFISAAVDFSMITGQFISAAIPSIFALPSGLPGMIQAGCLGLTCG